MNRICKCNHSEIAHAQGGVCWAPMGNRMYCYCGKFELAHIEVPTIPHATPPPGVNPKDLVGAKKVDLSIIPPIASALTAEALMDGHRKYGPFNWRSPDKRVGIRTYIAACKRHLDLFMEGEEFASDSGVPHLGHAMATLSVITDAFYNGFANDDRPPKAEYSQLIERVNERVKQKAEATK